MLETPLLPNPIGPSASRSFRFCVPDEWYRRSKSRTVSSSSTSSDVSQDTIRRLADLEESDEDEDTEGEGTAKQKGLDTSDAARGGFKAPMDWRGSISQSRFSSYLESWMRPQSPTGEGKPPSSPEKKVVSEPKLMEQRTGDSVSSTASNEQSSGVDLAEFEQMLVRLDGLRFANMSSSVEAG